MIRDASVPTNVPIGQYSPLALSNEVRSTCLNKTVCYLDGYLVPLDQARAVLVFTVKQIFTT